MISAARPCWWWAASSGIGNGIAHAFRDTRGARVAVWGTRPGGRADYQGEAELGPQRAFSYSPGGRGRRRRRRRRRARPSKTLDVLVLSQGWVVYRRGEFERAGWDRVMAVNLDSLMGCARKFHDALAAAPGLC